MIAQGSPRTNKTRDPESTQLDREDEIYCICQSSDIDRFMIACDKCNQWFHGDCVNIHEEFADNLLFWHCSQCVSQSDGLLQVYQERPLCAYVKCQEIHEKQHYSQDSSKFCSQECGEMNALLILQNLFHEKGYNVDLDKESSSLNRLKFLLDDCQTRLDKLNSKISHVKQQKIILQQSVALVDYLNMIMDDNDTLICGFNNWSKCQDDTNLSELNPQMTWQEINQLFDVCLQKRNKCSLHNMSHMVSKSSFERLASFQNLNLGNQLTTQIPNWAHLQWQQLDIYHQDLNQQCSHLSEQLIKFNHQIRLHEKQNIKVQSQNGKDLILENSYDLDNIPINDGSFTVKPNEVRALLYESEN